MASRLRTLHEHSSSTPLDGVKPFRLPGGDTVSFATGNEARLKQAIDILRTSLHLQDTVQIVRSQQREGRDYRTFRTLALTRKTSDKVLSVASIGIHAQDGIHTLPGGFGRLPSKEYPPSE